MLAALLTAARTRRTSLASPHRGYWATFAGVGVLVGLAALTRPNGVLLLLPLGFALGSWRRAAVMTAAALLTIAPWTIRNYVVTDAFVPVAANTGKTLAGTYNPKARTFRYRWLNPAELPPDYKAELNRQTEPERSSALTARAIDYVKSNPLSVPKAAAWNTLRLAELDTGGRTILRNVLRSKGLATASFIGFFLMALFAAVGLAMRPRWPLWLWLTPALFYLSAVLIAVNFSRFRPPLEPFIVLSAASALLGSRRAAPRAVPGG